MEANFSIDYNHLDYQDRNDVESDEKHFFLTIKLRNDQFTFHFSLNNLQVYRKYCDRTLFEDFAQGKDVDFFTNRFYNSDYQDVSIICRNGNIIIRKNNDTSSGSILFEIKHHLIKDQINGSLLHLIAHGFFD
jgi:hypothetical protein